MSAAADVSPAVYTYDGDVPQMSEWACRFGHPPLVAVHDESVSCANCWTAVCGIHAEPSAEDDELLCPPCRQAESERLARTAAALSGPACTAP